MPFAPSRPRSSSRLAVELDGYSLEAATHVHEHDRLGLEHLSVEELDRIIGVLYELTETWFQPIVKLAYRKLPGPDQKL
jgi:hypothetical protein